MRRGLSDATAFFNRMTNQRNGQSEKQNIKRSRPAEQLRTPIAEQIRMPIAGKIRTPIAGKTVELLAPAGNYECFRAAICAGADAVYLAGNRFGARAYADNFSKEQLIEAIHTAHLYGRKIYMTVNTLLKQEEIGELVSYMIPYYEAGLDGVIIQDLGVFQLLKRHFPGLELHCSTQMTLTGVEGASFAKKIGASRIVPARELSISEIRRIHESFPELELECFIHGALCYCYSGQCLFSSLIGGRSGNRGTCAQPCRLPYEVLLKEGELGGYEECLGKEGHSKCPRSVKQAGKEQYPLSLKDLSTIHMIPELIDAGIDSFKIEGRMKSAEYVAGVTGIYRSVIDRYLQNPEHFTGPEKEEMSVLSGLYVRSETEEGYYHHYNGKHMITPERPSYSGCSEEALEYVRTRFMQEMPGIPVTFRCILKIDQPAILSAACSGENVTVKGDIVTQAKKKPLSQADVHKQLQKTGGTVFCAEQTESEQDDMIFMPVSRLNELRRLALEKLREQLLEKGMRNYQKPQETEDRAENTERQFEAFAYAACVRTGEQLLSCLKNPLLKRIYVDSSLWNQLLSGNTAAGDDIRNEIRKNLKENRERLWFALPRIIRSKNRDMVKRLLQKLQEEGYLQGIYVHSLDGYELACEFLRHYDDEIGNHIILSPFVFAMNSESVDFWQGKCSVMTLPLELNEKELQTLNDTCRERHAGFEMMVYGRIPFMVTANCIWKSFGEKGCSHSSEIGYLRDRRQSRLPVVSDCANCYNVIYNSVPLSLHRHLDRMKQSGIADSLMLSFTTESGVKTEEILNYYTNAADTEWEPEEYTNGHFLRGVL